MADASKSEERGAKRVREEAAAALAAVPLTPIERVVKAIEQSERVVFDDAGRLRRFFWDNTDRCNGLCKFNVPEAPFTALKLLHEEVVKQIGEDSMVNWGDGAEDPRKRGYAYWCPDIPNKLKL